MAGVAERTLALKLIGDVSGLRKDLKPAQRQIGQFTKGLASWGKALAGGVLIGGVERLAGALGDAWDGYRSGEKAAAQLRKTWKNLGLEGKAYRGVLDKVTASTLALGTSDDEAVEAFGRSLNRTRDYQQSLRELSIAQDLVASGSATNLESAFRLIQQAGKGSARVVDRFGLDAKTAGGRIRQLGDQVKGTAKAKAKLDPMGVLFNRLAEDSEAIVGAFAKGDFQGVVKGLQGLGESVADALFGGKGKDNIRNSKTAGLVNQFGGWASTLATGIQKEFAKVDWGKTLTDTLNAGLGALQTAISNGTLANLALVGAALAGAVFAVDLFITAASAMFSLPRWALGAGAKVAGAVVGRAMRGAIFVAELFAKSMTVMFEGITSSGTWATVEDAIKRVGITTGTVLQTGLIAGLTAGLLLLIGNALRGALTGALEALGLGNVADLLNMNPIQDRTGTGGATKGPGRKTGFASGTTNAPRGWHWVGERGPELMRFRGGEQVIPNRPSMAGGGPTIVVNVNGYVGSETQLARELNRILSSGVQRGMRLGYR